MAHNLRSAVSSEFVLIKGRSHSVCKMLTLTHPFCLSCYFLRLLHSAHIPLIIKIISFILPTSVKLILNISILNIAKAGKTFLSHVHRGSLKFNCSDSNSNVRRKTSHSRHHTILVVVKHEGRPILKNYKEINSNELIQILKHFHKYNLSAGLQAS